MTEVWAANIGDLPGQHGRQPGEGRAISMAGHGVRWVTPTADEINSHAQAHDGRRQDQMAKESKINPDLVRAVTVEVGPSV